MTAEKEAPVEFEEEKVVVVEEQGDKGYQSWIFKPRLTEADSKSYYDDEALDAMFDLDWRRAVNTEKFQKVLARAMKLKATGVYDIYI